MIEMVQNAETLRKIQGEHGLTGAFKDMTIAEWLARNNPSELEYARAVENFTCELRASNCSSALTRAGGGPRHLRR